VSRRARDAGPCVELARSSSVQSHAPERVMRRMVFGLTMLGFMVSGCDSPSEFKVYNDEKAVSADETEAKALNPFGVMFDWEGNVSSLIVEQCPCLEACPQGTNAKGNYLWVTSADPEDAFVAPLPHPLAYGTRTKLEEEFLPDDAPKGLTLGKTYRIHANFYEETRAPDPDIAVDVDAYEFENRALDFEVTEDGSVRVVNEDPFANDESCDL
jgi:hypothetical protein